MNNGLVSYRNIWKVSYPIIAGSIAQNLINVADTAFLGQLGPLELGAAGNSIIFYFIFIVLGIGFAVGGEIIVGRRNGEKNFSQVGRTVDHCFYALIPLSILLFLIMSFYSADILHLVTENKKVADLGEEYLDYRKHGIFFAFLNLAFRTFYIGVTRTGILTWSTGLMAIVNIVLDYLLIFGHFGFPEMGLKGAAIASVIAELSASIYFIIYTITRVDVEKYGLLKFKQVDVKIVKNVAVTALPMMLQHFAAITSWMIFFLIIEKIGSEELAISHIIRSIYMVLMIPLFGFAGATNTLVSNLIGQGNTVDVPYLVKRIAILTLLSTSLIIPFNLLIPDVMIGIYTNSHDLIEKAKSVLYVITGAMMLFSLTYILFSAVSGTGNTKVSLLIEVSTLLVYLTSTYYIGIVLKSSLPIVWCSEFIYFGTMGILSFLYLKYGKWRELKI